MIDREYRFATWLLIIICGLGVVKFARDGEVSGCGVLLIFIGLLARGLKGVER